jgi:hypothetical protein
MYYPPTLYISPELADPWVERFWRCYDCQALGALAGIHLSLVKIFCTQKVRHELLVTILRLSQVVEVADRRSKSLLVSH